MMRLDGAPVLRGDRVWHDRYGWGVVADVVGGTCDVRFDTQPDAAVTFADGGLQGRFKTLWWQEPMLFVPQKGKDYTGLLEMVSALMLFKYGAENE